MGDLGIYSEESDELHFLNQHQCNEISVGRILLKNHMKKWGFYFNDPGRYQYLINWATKLNAMKEVDIIYNPYSSIFVAAKSIVYDQSIRIMDVDTNKEINEKMKKDVFDSIVTCLGDSMACLN